MITQDYATTTQRTLITNEELTIRRLPVRNPLATKNEDTSYSYMGNRYYSRSTLIKRGWTTEDIKNRLGDADVTTTNPYNNRMHMDLFLACDVEDLENAMGWNVFSVEQAIANGNITAGIKVKLNTLSHCGIYTSVGNGHWTPNGRNQNQMVLTTLLLEFWNDNGFPVEYVV
jgi:hypothetical protein